MIDNPGKEFFERGNTSYSYVGDLVTKLYIPVYPINNAAERKDKFDATIKIFKTDFYSEFGEGTDSSTDTMEKYWFIQNYLAGMTSYDHTLNLEWAHFAYGVLAEGGQVVCEGYAKAYKVLCDSVGLPCMLIVGEGASSGTFTGDANHMWNAVEVDGSWYCLDVTWDDADNISFSDTATYPFLISMVQYTYFLNNDHFDNTPDDGLYKKDSNHAATGYLYPETPAYDLPDLADGENSQYSGAKELKLSGLDIEVNGESFVASNLKTLINNGKIGDIYLIDADNVDIILASNVSISGILSVPEGKTYTITGKDDIYTLSGSNMMIEVTGSLILDDVIISNGGIFSLTNPVINVAEAASLTETESGIVDGYVRYDDIDYMSTSTSYSAYFEYPEKFMSGANVLISFNNVTAEDVNCYQVSYSANGQALDMKELEMIGVDESSGFNNGAWVELAALDGSAATVKLILLTGEKVSPVSEAVEWELSA